MRRIVQLSDLHFGAEDRALLPPLTDTLELIKPDVLVVSGDLTQRARSREFAAAKEFLTALPFPKVVVPGNHDVPLYNVFMRAFRPLDRYREYFGDEMVPFYSDAEIAVVGINTARSLTFKNGRINEFQVTEVCERFNALPQNVIRIVVTHHPFEDSDTHGGLVGRAEMAMAGFSDCRVDIVLSGHMHTSRAGFSAEHFDHEGFSALLVQAGTATSVRRRGETNSFNVVAVDGRQVTVERWTWDAPAKNYQLSKTERFAKEGSEWSLPQPSHLL